MPTSQTLVIQVSSRNYRLIRKWLPYPLSNRSVSARSEADTHLQKVPGNPQIECAIKMQSIIITINTVGYGKQIEWG